MTDLRLTLRQINRLLNLSLHRAIFYRGDLILWFFAITATPLLSLAVWYQVAQSASNLIPREILTYYLLIMLVRLFTSSWRGYGLIQQILNGEIVSYLIRPPAIYWEFVTTTLATRLLQLTIPVIGLVTAIILRPQIFAPAIFNLPHLLLFIPSLLIAFIISFTFDLNMGLLAFWLEDAQELMSYRFLLTQFTSGIIIPFSLMPAWLHQAFSLLPFRYIISVPAEILLGQVAKTASLRLIGYQLLWAAAMIVIMRILYVKGLKRYAIPGQ